jgi:hypothetical protein
MSITPSVRAVSERCTCEIPNNQNDAVVCGATSDILCEEGPRCRTCFIDFGGTPVAPELSPAVKTAGDNMAALLAEFGGKRADFGWLAWQDLTGGRQ